MAAASIVALKNNVDEFICDANEAVNFKMIKDTCDLENENLSFHPDMSHQIFGEKEQVFGFRDLRINILYSASQLFGYVGVNYSEKISAEKYDGVESDDVLRKMQEVLPPGCCNSIDEFSARVQKDCDFIPHGEKVYQYERTAKDGSKRYFEIFNPDMMENPGFKDYHDRMQTFLLWFVDAASYIDTDDDMWEYYTVFERTCGDSGRNMYLFVGYCTVYNFYAYPEHSRPRISQFLILPPYQRQGHATEILDVIQKRLSTRTKIRDICVEDPSENFQRIRDYVDCRNCVQFDCFRPEKLMSGFSKSMIKECNEKLKLNRRQTRRIYEILRLKNTNMLNELEFKAYRIDVKLRLNAPFSTKKYGKRLDQSDAHSDEERFNILERSFNELLEEYLSVVERLNRDAV